jgi:hypothetical protein
MNHAVEQAGETADRLREELLRTLEELERRGQKAMDWRAQLRQHRGLALGIAGVLALTIGANVGVAVWANQRHVRRLPARRREALARTWQHPERLARPRPGIPTRFARTLVVYAAARITAGLLRRVGRQLIG